MTAEIRERLVPRLVYPFVESGPLISPVLEGLPQNDILMEDLRILRERFRSSMLAKHKGNPTIDRIKRIEEYIDNYTCLLPYEFREDSPPYNHRGNVRQFARLCRDILTENGENVLWDGIYPRIKAKFIDTHLGVGPDVRFRPHKVIWNLPHNTTKARQLVYCEPDETGYYEFDDSNGFYASVAYFYIREHKDRNINISEQLEREGLFRNEVLRHIIPVVSFLTEDIFLKRPIEFQDFMVDIAVRIGGEEGFAAAAAILEDLWILYQPLFNEEDQFTWYPLKDPEPLLRSASEKLKETYKIWRYENRPAVISPEVRTLALGRMETEGDPIRGFYSYLEEVYTGLGAGTKFEELLTEDEITPIRWIFERAPNEKKLEAGQIPIIADILGYDDQETLILITNLTQLLWTTILEEDNTIDQTPSRNGAEALYVREGMSAGIQKPLLTIIKVVRRALEHERINNTLLGRSLIAMLDELYSGDISNRELGWNSDFSAFDTNMRRIMQVISWFPRYLAKVGSLTPEAAETLAQFLENFGCLLLINNDFDDLEDSSHAAGDDIGGGRVNTVMHAFYNCQEVPQAERDEFRNICEDPGIKRKRNTFTPFDDEDKAKIARALEIGRKYRTTVAKTLESTINSYYFEASRLLDKAFKTDLPSYDDRNEHYHRVYQNSLDGLSAKLKMYREQA